MNFTHLHVHTEYSLLDGCSRIKPLIDRAAELGQTSIAITDHGVMYGCIDFYKYAIEKGVKPIIGCEVYVAPKSRFEKQKTVEGPYSHLVLLCENNTGYNNLIKLVSLGFTEGFYNKPRVDRELLEKYHEGLIALSACLAGELPKYILNNEYSKAKETALWYKNVFGENNYFIELQNHGIREQRLCNPQLIRLSKETGIPLVATNDVHYILKEDNRMHKVLLCVQTGSKITEDNALEFKTNEFYLKTGEEMSAAFPECPQAIENTLKIAERCFVEFEFGKIKLPRFDIGDKDHFEYLKEKALSGMHKIYGESPAAEVRERLDYELSVINRMGYVDYFLIVADFVNYAKNNDIPVGPGRGSGAGSLVAYCIGITGIDPIKYNLFFERFLNPERVSMPDFDIDFCFVNRQKVIDYVINKYGEERVSQIVTFGTMKARAAIRDVGRVMDYPYALCDRVAKLIPQSPGMNIERALAGSKELRELYENDGQVKALIDMSQKLEGMPRHASTHAAGVVIADRPVAEYVPLSVNEDAVVTQYTMTSLEELGLLKMDFLGLRNLTVIDDAQKYIRNNNPDFDIEKIPLDDKPTYTLMGKGLTDGVFQFESDGMKNVLRQFGPESIEDLTAILSLYRPGPMDSIPKYIHNRHNPQDITYLTPLLKPILDVTYGCIVYQEQVMQVFRSLAGYSFGRADIVRRAMAKKKHEVMRREKEFFINGERDEEGHIICEGAVARGVDRVAAEQIFEDMSSFSSYAFNKAHAAAYSFVAYRTAYLKCHYPAEYLAALMSSMVDNAPKLALYNAECKRLGVRLLKPHINNSFAHFSPESGNVRFGLLAIRNLGQGIIDRLVSERLKNGEYTSMYDFCRRNYSREFNRKALEGLIKAGALDGLEDNRRQMLYNIEGTLEAVEIDVKFSGDGQLNLFEEMGAPKGYIPQKVEDMDEETRLSFEKEVTGIYISGHPMDRYSRIVSSGKYAKTIDILSGKFSDGDRVTVAGIISNLKVRQLKNNKLMASAQIEDVYTAVNVTVFESAYVKYKSLIGGQKPVILTGRVAEREDRDTEIICMSVEELPDIPISKKRMASGLYIKLKNTECAEFLSVKEILDSHKGDTAVYIYCTQTGKKLEAPKSLWVTVNEDILGALYSVLGEENVKIVE